MIKKYTLVLMISFLTFAIDGKTKKTEIKKNTKKKKTPSQQAAVNSEKNKGSSIKKSKKDSPSQQETSAIKSEIKEGQIFDQLIDTKEEIIRENNKVEQQQIGLTALANEFNQAF